MNTPIKNIPSVTRSDLTTVLNQPQYPTLSKHDIRIREIALQTMRLSLLVFTGTLALSLTLIPFTIQISLTIMVVACLTGLIAYGALLKHRPQFSAYSSHQEQKTQHIDIHSEDEDPTITEINQRLLQNLTHLETYYLFERPGMKLGPAIVDSVLQRFPRENEELHSEGKPIGMSYTELQEGISLNLCLSPHNIDLDLKPIKFRNNKSGQPIILSKKIAQGGCGKVVFLLNLETGLSGIFKYAALSKTKKAEILEKSNGNHSPLEVLIKDEINSRVSIIKKEYYFLHALHGKDLLFGIQPPPKDYLELEIEEKIKKGYLENRIECSFSKYLKDNNPSIEDLSLKFLQLLIAAEILDGKNVLHGDYKNPNLGISKGWITIRDFGGAVQVTHNTPIAAILPQKRYHTFGYYLSKDFEKAQEFHDANDLQNLVSIERKRDVFGVGCCFFKSTFQTYPYSKHKLTKKLVETSPKIVVRENCPKELSQLIYSMINTDYNQRPSFKEARQKMQNIVATTFPNSYDKLVSDLKEIFDYELIVD